MHILKLNFLWFIVFCVVNTTALLSQKSMPTYSIVEVTLDLKEDVRVLLDLGIAADHVHFHDENNLELFLSDRELEILEANGFEYEYVVRDTKAHADKLASKYDKSDLKNNACGLQDYSLGLMGGYLTYDDVISRLKKIEQLYPDIASTKLLGTTYEGNEIIALKISDNVGTNENLFEGSAYYDALTHAREPLSMMSTLYYIEWLLENYDNPNTIAKYLVDNRQMHFVLIVNPDGYRYNSSQSPNGGGGWRKNRRVVDDNGCIGVDLNRNFKVDLTRYPDTYSDEPCAETYRGIKPASELETQYIQAYIDEVQPAIAFTSHSFSDLFIEPSSIIDPSNYPDYDFDVYSKYASEFTPESYNGYGPSFNLIGYEASGTTQDYLSEAGAIVWTPEIGTQFYEPQNKICEHVTAMLEPMKFISKVAGTAPVYHHHYVPENTFIMDGETIELLVGIKNKGLRESNKTFTAILSSNESGISIQNPIYEFRPLRDEVVLYNEEQPYLIDILSIDQELPITFELKIYEEDVMIDASTFEVLPGSQKIIFKEDFEDGLDKWFQSNELNRWTTSDTDAKSGNNMLVDSKAYHDNFFQSSVGLREPIDLSGTVRPHLFFNIKRSFSPSSGYASLYVSENQSLSDLSSGNLILKTYNGNSYWTEEAVDLTYVSQNFGPIYLKFLVQVAGSNITDGLYVDNIRIVDLGLDQTTSTTNTISDDVHIKIYPNPTVNSVTVKTDNFGGFSQVEVINAMGQIVRSYDFDISMHRTVIDLSNEPTGHYFIKTHTPSGVNLKKITKM